MSTQTAQSAVAKSNPFHMIGALGGVAMLSGLLIVFVYQGTAPRIKANREAALQRAIFRVLPDAASYRTFSIDAGEIAPIDNDAIADRKIYAGYNSEGAFAGVAIEAEGRGYQDVIRMLYGYSPDSQCITGTVILQSTETPGLGDKIAKDKKFLANFECLDSTLSEDGTALANPIVTVKHGKKTSAWQIDGITGATISCRAVGDMLNATASELHPLIARHVSVFTGETP